jgi:uncharacterized protein (DUF433 family)
MSWTERIRWNTTTALPSTSAIATIAEKAMKNFERITIDRAEMDGLPCVRHLRIPVATILRLLAGGLTEREILTEYPDLETDDIRECLRFAAATAMERELPLPHSA